MLVVIFGSLSESSPRRLSSSLSPSPLLHLRDQSPQHIVDHPVGSHPQVILPCRPFIRFQGKHGLNAYLKLLESPLSMTT